MEVTRSVAKLGKVQIITECAVSIDEANRRSILENIFQIYPYCYFSFFRVSWTFRAYVATVPPGIGILHVLIISRVFINCFLFPGKS